MDPIILTILIGGALIYAYRTKKRYNECLTCRKCGALAQPISGTRNRYRCPGCGKQFAAAKHSF
jgi:transposase-like protein